MYVSSARIFWSGILWIQMRCFCPAQGRIFWECFINRDMNRATGRGYDTMNQERGVGVDYMFK